MLPNTPVSDPFVSRELLRFSWTEEANWKDTLHISAPCAGGLFYFPIDQSVPHGPAFILKYNRYLKTETNNLCKSSKPFKTEFMKSEEKG